MAARAGPWAGLRILELGVGAAGPLATRAFAEHGADVVRVESARRPDFLRLLPPAPGQPEGLDASLLFAAVNPGKRSIAVDLRREEGRALVLRLVDRADVVLENFAPGVMERLGLAPEALAARRPELIVVSSALFGQTGPQRDYPGFGGQGAAIAGFDHLTGWPDGEPVGPFATITDTLSPRYVAALVAAALLLRRRTGRGQRIDVSQIETGVYSLSEAIVRRSATGEIVSRDGNRDARAAPHGIYPCDGDDAWIAIAVGDDAAWRALVALMDEPAWACAPALATSAGRLAARDEIDARLAAWTRAFGPYELMAGLQAAGVPAGVVQHPDELLRDPQLAHRHHFQRLEHPVLGALLVERSGVRLGDGSGGFTRAAPRLGEDTDAVLRDWLDLAPDAIAALRAHDVLV